MNEGGNVLPVQNISQPAVLTINMHLMPFVPSRVCHVLWNKASDTPNLNASERLMSLLFDACLYTLKKVLTYENPYKFKLLSKGSSKDWECRISAFTF